MLLDYLEKIKTAHVLVVGDVMLDHYWSGDTGRVSPEAPVPVVQVNQGEFRLGGAANVAKNIASLGAKVTLLAHCGADDKAETLSQLLQESGVRAHLEKHPGYETITKVRVMSQNQQLLRLDFERPLQEADAVKVLPRYSELLAEVDAVVLSDYGKGAMLAVHQLLSAARQRKLPVLVDPKSDDFSCYQGASCITPNLKEFEQVVGPCRDNTQLVEKAEKLLVAHDLDSLLVTQGKEGMSLIQRGQAAVHLPTQAQEVYDVTGAGDTVIATMAAAVGGNIPAVDAARLANLAAGIVVSKLGTAAVTHAELSSHSTKSLLDERGEVCQETCRQLCLAAKAQGKRVVMTNGCFDLLHPGHLHYLAQARALGDYLIIAVNSDESIKTLKGESRPINPLKDRLALLAALHVVDWVVPFNEETPEELYAAVLPDVLVKGGDYQVDEVAGHKQVLAAGGEVKILDFIPGYSSSKIIEKIQAEEKGSSL